MFLINARTQVLKKNLKRIFNHRIQSVIDEMMSIEDLNLCMAVDKRKDVKDQRKSLKIQLIDDCEYVVRKSFNFSRKSILSKVMPSHNHFHSLIDLLIFLKVFGFSLDFIEKNSFEKFLQRLYRFLTRFYLCKLEKYLDEESLNSKAALFDPTFNLTDIFNQYLESVVKFHLFP